MLFFPAPLLSSTVAALGETHSMVQENFDGDMTRQTVLCIVLPLTLLAIAILAFNVWNLRQAVDQQGSTIMKLRWESKNSAELDQI